MKVLYLIPARGGSKGLPGKNIKLLYGKPLICYTIDAARTVAKDGDICVSTDDEGILETVEKYGLAIPFKRPKELATDKSGSEEVILHALKHYSSLGKFYDYVCLLQPTSPLRSGKHIEEALSLLEPGTEMVVSVKETSANPYYVLFEENEKGELQQSKESTFIRRQDCPKVYELNGAIYLINISKLIRKGMSALQKKKYVMDKAYSVDIDDDIDFYIAEMLLSKYAI